MPYHPHAGNFKPGFDPRRAKGRPKGSTSINDLLRRIGAEPSDKPIGGTKLEELMRKVYDFALAGAPWAVTFIAERTEGKVRDEIAISADTKPVASMSIPEIEAALAKEIEDGAESPGAAGEIIDVEASEEPPP